MREKPRFKPVDFLTALGEQMLRDGYIGKLVVGSATDAIKPARLYLAERTGDIVNGYSLYELVAYQEQDLQDIGDGRLWVDLQVRKDAHEKVRNAYDVVRAQHGIDTAILEPVDVPNRSMDNRYEKIIAKVKPTSNQ
ncbi:MAG: hypothetical protein ABIC04_08110 [Nanoarchaeota archaeon]